MVLRTPPNPLLSTSSRVLTVAHSQTESPVPSLVPVDVCSLQSCPGLLAKGLSAPARAGGNASCRYECDWSCSSCHVLSVAGGRASFSALKVGLGRRRQHSNTQIPGSCQPGIEEATCLFQLQVRCFPVSLLSSRGFTDSHINFTGWRGRAGGQGKQRVQPEHSRDGSHSMQSWGWQSGIMPEPCGKDFSPLSKKGAGTNTVTCKPVVSRGVKPSRLLHLVEYEYAGLLC